MKGFAFRFGLVFIAVFAALFFFVWFYLSAVSPAEAGEPPPAAQMGQQQVFPIAQARLHTASAAHDFRAELALTPSQRALGLMHRDNVPLGTAMVFDFKAPRPIAMWMKNTPASLDMLFADNNGRILYIAHDTVPFSEALVSPPDPAARVRYVMEVASGTAKRLNVRVGDRLTLVKDAP